MITAKQGEDLVASITPGQPVEFAARVTGGCAEGCDVQIRGSWTITLVPRTDESRLPDPRDPEGARGVGPSAVIEQRIVGDTASVTPKRPGRAIVQHTAVILCGDRPCPTVVGARAEFEIRSARLDEAGSARVLAQVESLLPEIPGGRALQDQERALRASWRAAGQTERADRGISSTAKDYERAVGAWFAGATGWKPGERYVQRFVLPGGCTRLRRVSVASSSAREVTGWLFDEPGLEPGARAISSVPVFGTEAEASVRVTGGGDDQAILELDLPMVDAFHLGATYLDARGRRQSVSLVCLGTANATGGAPTIDRCPGPGGVRIRLCNVDPSRLEGEEYLTLSRAVRLIAARLGCGTISGGHEVLRDAQGRESVFAEAGLSGGSVPAPYIARWLEPIAQLFEARVVVEGGIITLVGKDLGSDKPLLPVRFGGAPRR